MKFFVEGYSMICQECGFETINAAVKFCVKCGTPLKPLNEGSIFEIDPPKTKNENALSVWEGWELTDFFGEGSYGKVYKAVKKDHYAEMVSAVKIIKIPKSQAELNSLHAEGIDIDGSRTYIESIINSFVHEIKMMISLNGAPNIVTIYDYKVVEKPHEIGWEIYIRMELLTSFEDYTMGKTLTEKEIIKIGTDICSALEYCAKQNPPVIHRDIKPGNIFISKSGDFKLGDFGIARELEKSKHFYSMAGTPNYMAPEVKSGDLYGVTADIYSLGIVLYRLANKNRLPFCDIGKQMLNPSDYEEALRTRLSGESLPSPENAGEHLAEAILKACAFSARDRFQTASGFKAALQAVDHIQKKSNTAGKSMTKKHSKIEKLMLMVAVFSSVCLLGGAYSILQNITAVFGPQQAVWIIWAVFDFLVVGIAALSMISTMSAKAKKKINFVKGIAFFALAISQPIMLFMYLSIFKGNIAGTEIVFHINFFLQTALLGFIGLNHFRRTKVNMPVALAGLFGVGFAGLAWAATLYKWGFDDTSYGIIFPGRILGKFQLAGLIAFLAWTALWYIAAYLEESKKRKTILKNKGQLPAVIFAGICLVGSLFFFLYAGLDKGRGNLMNTTMDDSVRVEFTTQPTNTAVENTRGNTNNNIVNGGYMAKQGEWIYYNNLYEAIYKIRADGSGKSKIIDGVGRNINVIGEWLYYGGGSGIHKIRTDGTGETVIYSVGDSDLDNWIENFIVIGDLIYYSTYTGLYKMNTDGTNKIKMCDGQPMYLNVVDEWIYYQDHMDNWYLCKIRTDGTGKAKIGNEDGGDIIESSGWIYYRSPGGHSLRKIRPDGSDLTILDQDTSIGNINVVGEWIYYRVTNENDDTYQLCKIRIDGTGKTKVGESIADFPQGVYVIDDWIYYYVFESSSIFSLVLYKMQTNGAERQLV